MNSCGDVNAVEGHPHCSMVIWPPNHSDDRHSHPQLPDADLGVMYATPCSTMFVSDTSSYAPSPSTMTTLSEPSSFPSPASPAMSPYFTEPMTPAEPPVKKQSHGRRRPPGHIPRPRNAFILFRSHYVAAQLIPGKVENDHRHISKIIGEIWNTLPPAERLVWEQKADVEKERHSRMYPGYRYKPLKLEGVVKRRVKCRGAPALKSPYSSTPGIGTNGAPLELVGSLNVSEGGSLRFVDNEKSRFIDQEERRKDRTRCARVAALVKQGVVGEQLEQEAQRLGLDRESAMIGTPQLEPSVNDPPGMRGHFHTNVDVLRALGDDVPVFRNPFVPQNPEVPHIVYTPPACNASNSCTPTDSYSPASSHGAAGPTASDHASYDDPDASDADKPHSGWPHRRASSLPLPPPPPFYQEVDTQPRLAIVEPQRSKPTPSMTLLPRRPSSSSSMRRYRRLYHPYPPRKENNQGLEEDQRFNAFNHVSYRSPTNSPPEYFYSPGPYPNLQLNYPASESTSPHTSLLSPLYGIDAVHGDRHEHEHIDLSVMYHEQDIPTGNDSTLHSTYATTGKAPAPIPVAPATVATEHGLPAREPVHNQAPPSALGLGSPPGPTYDYDWCTSYGAEPGYTHPPGYNTNTLHYNEETQQIYYTSRAGGAAY